MKHETHWPGSQCKLIWLVELKLTPFKKKLSTTTSTWAKSTYKISTKYYLLSTKVQVFFSTYKILHYFCTFRILISI